MKPSDKPHAPRILLCFNGDQDPLAKDGGEGPILSLAGGKPGGWDKAFIFHTPDRREKAEQTREKWIVREPVTDIALETLPIDDPICHENVLKALRQGFAAIRDESAEYDVFVSPGTPAMHACWLLLAAAGEIPARRIFQTRNPRYVGEGQSLVMEIDPQSREFPGVQSRLALKDLPPMDPAKVDAAIREAGIIGNDPLLQESLWKGARAAQGGAAILVLGENGTGKELIADFLHRVGPRFDGPFIVKNCAAIQDTLMESELFGHKKGAFTDARKDRKGAFDQAEGGTLFLDEIGEFSPTAQAKLLRAIEQKTVQPVGDPDAHPVDVRVIAATNRNLEQAAADGDFRADLFYRLSTFTIHLPPLRRRRGDIPLLAAHFRNRFNAHYNRDVKIPPEMVRRLQNGEWKGNIRELKSVLERLVVYSRTEAAGEADMNMALSGGQEDEAVAPVPEPFEGFDMHAYLSGVRTRLIRRALELADGNKSRAGRLLGVSHSAINKHLNVAAGDGSENA